MGPSKSKAKQFNVWRLALDTEKHPEILALFMQLLFHLWRHWKIKTDQLEALNTSGILSVRRGEVVTLQVL